MPETNAEYTKSKNIINVKYTTSAKPEKVLAWYALSKTKDFRESEWQPVEMKGNGKKYTCNIKKPSDKTLAVFTEGQFKDKKIPYILSNKVKVF